MRGLSTREPEFLTIEELTNADALKKYFNNQEERSQEHQKCKFYKKHFYMLDDI